MKKKLLISFSGGETSAYMTYWIMQNWVDQYDITIIFANTGQEDERTLQFVKMCSDYFKWEVIWVELLKYNGRNIEVKVVDFDSAKRNGEPFETMIKKFGIPNVKFKHCSRELKTRVIRKQARGLGLTGYYTAIGYRCDEMDRMDDKAKGKKFLYPLISPNPKTKKQINEFWDSMPFRLAESNSEGCKGLGLKGWEGNCKWCFKKSMRKLAQKAKDEPSAFDFPKKMEEQYENFVPDSRKHNKDISVPIRFFRKHMTTDQILEFSKTNFTPPIDDTQRVLSYQQLSFMFETGELNEEMDFSNGCEESCEAF